MIAWNIIKPALTSLIVDIAGLAPEQVKWRDEAEGSTWHMTPTVYLFVSSITRQGIEYEDHIAPDMTGSYPYGDQPAILIGQRQFTLEIRVESFEQDIASPDFAGNIANQIAIRLMRSTSIEQLMGKCAIEYRQPTHWISYKVADRQMSAYIFDLMMRTADVDRYNQSWIGDTKLVPDTKPPIAPFEVSIFPFPTP